MTPPLALPDFLRETFEGTSLEEVPSTLVALDPTGKILWFNAAWTEFAKANGGEDVLARFGPGSLYFDAIQPPLRAFYESALSNALLTGEPFEQEYECSSPDTFRLHHLRALPFGTDGLLLDHSLVVGRPHEHEHTAAAAIEARYRDAHGIILQCANCRRVRRRNDTTWDWVRAWVVRTPPHTSHGICGPCVGYYWGEILRRR